MEFSNVAKTEVSKTVKVMLITIFDGKGIATVSFCHRGQMTNQQVYKRPSTECFTQCARRDETGGRMNCERFAMTMHLLTISWLFGNSWITILLCWKNLPIHLNSLQVTFFFFLILFIFPKFKFWRCGGHQESWNDGAEWYPRRILLAMHRSMTEKDGKVHETQER